MKKVFALLIALLVFSAPAYANLVVNGDFETGDETGWTRWNSSWGGGFSWSVYDAGMGDSTVDGVLATDAGSFGWAQAISVVAGETYTITADWMGNGSNNWCEVLFFNDDGRDIVSMMDAPDDSYIIAKVDGWGMNGGMPFSGPITSYYYPSGLGTNQVVATGDTMWVGLKTGASGGTTVCAFDDVVVTGPVVPEPASILAMFIGVGGMILRRKH